MYFTTNGLVNISMPKDTIKNTITCKNTLPQNDDTITAASAPIANQIVVSPTVTISITISIIIAASHTIAFIDSLLSYKPLRLRRLYAQFDTAITYP